jgi:hypothetical protein
MEIDDIGKILTLPVISRCNDGRKIPEGIDQERFMQMNVYQWREDSPYSGTIFVYNPFLVHPIDTKSIVEVIDPNRETFKKKYHKHSWFHLPRIFDNKDLNLDPIHATEGGIIVFEESMPKGTLYFQHNPQNPKFEIAYLIETTQKKFMDYFREMDKHEVFCGKVEQKTRQ